MFRRSFLLAVSAWTLVLFGGCRRENPRATVADDISPASSTTIRKQALLVGVTKYDHGYKSLFGPANDVQLFQRVLVDTFGYSPQSIITLSEKSGASNQPTRANIKRAFDLLTQEAQPGDQIAILLSGHGCEQPDQVPPDPDDPEPDGMDQVFLPADAGRPDLKSKTIPNGIIDDELRVWLKALTDKGARIFLIADCCHAGTLLRGETDEGERGIPAEQLWPPEVLKEARAHGTRATGQLRGDAPAPAPFKLQKQGSIVALYACQPEQRTYEFPLPDRTQGDPRCGLLTWNVCQLLSKANSPLTYRELAQQAHASIVRFYEDSGLAREKMPIPFAEGDDLDREVLRAKRWPGRSRLVLRCDKKTFINGGKLQGLYPGTILAVRPVAGSDSPQKILGYVRITKSSTFTAEVEPWAYRDLKANTDLPDSAAVEPVYLVYDLKSLRIFLGDVPDADRRLLQPILRTMADNPNSLVEQVRERDKANWQIRAADSKLWLLPAAVDAEAISSNRFELSRDSLATSLQARLERIARGQNLLTVASSSAGEPTRAGINVEVEIRKLRNEEDITGTRVSGTGRALTLVSGDWIRYRATNRGEVPVDVTLLAVFSDYSIHSFLPEKNDATNNRLLPGQSIQTAPLKVNADTVGLEHLVMIAVEGTGRQQVDFACLEEDDWQAARGALMRGSAQPVLETPLGKLFAHALFRRGQTRGTSPSTDRSQMRLLSWYTLPDAKE